MLNCTVVGVGSEAEAKLASVQPCVCPFVGIGLGLSFYPMIIDHHNIVSDLDSSSGSFNRGVL